MLAATLSAHAIPTLSFSANNGADWVTVQDGSALDRSAVAGEITYYGYLGRWQISLTGQARPAVGSATDPILNLRDVNINSRVGGTLLIRFVETDYFLGSTAGVFTDEVAGTVAARGQLSFQTYTDPDNSMFLKGLGIQLTGQGNFYGGPFSDTATSTFGASSEPYSLMLQARFTSRVGGRTTFSQSLVDPPVPDGGATVLLLGLGLGGLGLIMRARRQA